MKELYIAPELELLCLTAKERLANGEIVEDFDGLLANTNQGVNPSDGDIDIPLDDLGL